jgi:hypothetical protein
MVNAARRFKLECGGKGAENCPQSPFSALTTVTATYRGQ